MTLLAIFFTKRSENCLPLNLDTCILNKNKTLSDYKMIILYNRHCSKNYDENKYEFLYLWNENPEIKLKNMLHKMRWEQQILKEVKMYLPSRNESEQHALFLCNFLLTKSIIKMISSRFQTFDVYSFLLFLLLTSI